MSSARHENLTKFESERFKINTEKTELTKLREAYADDIKSLFEDMNMGKILPDSVAFLFMRNQTWEVLRQEVFLLFSYFEFPNLLNHLLMNCFQLQSSIFCKIQDKKLLNLIKSSSLEN